MKRVAFFVDGNYLFNQVKYFNSFFLTGENLVSYCKRHLEPNEEIYRIFYYDAPPLEMSGKNPLGNEVDFSATPGAEKMKKHLEQLRQTPYVALRLGRVSWHNDWRLNPTTFNALLEGAKTLGDLAENDFIPNIKQKAVDMKVGIDIATVAFKKLASRIVIIAGDSDFAPAAKLARTEGLHVTLDSFGAKPSIHLLKHIDWMASPLNPQDKKDIGCNRGRFVNKIKTIK